MIGFVTKRISTIFYIAFVLMILVALVIFAAGLIVQEGRESSRISIDIINNLDTLHSDLKRTESIQKEFIITGKEELLELSNLKADGITKTLPEMEVKFRFPSQLTNLERLESLVENQFDLLNSEVEVARKEGIEAAKEIVIDNYDPRLSEDIFQTFEAIKEEERINLSLHLSGFDELGAIITILIISGSLATLIMIFLAGKKIRKDVETNDELAGMLSEKNGLLEKRNEEYEEIAEKLKLQNNELKEKTEKLEDLNKKMIEREMQMIELKKQLDILKSQN